MKPVLFQIFGTSFYSYYIFVTLGIFAGLYLFYKYSKRSDINATAFLDISIMSIISGYVGGRIFHVLFSVPSYYIEHPQEIFYFWSGGYAIYGATITPILFIYIYSKYKKFDFMKVTDALAPALSMGTAIGRIGCFMQGCCYGKETKMPWGIIFPEGTNGGITPSNILLHPTQIYLSLHGLLMFFILRHIFNNKKYDGQITYWYFVLYALGRFIIELFRADERGGTSWLSSFQIISIILFCWFTYKIIKKHKSA